MSSVQKVTHSCRARAMSAGFIWLEKARAAREPVFHDSLSSRESWRTPSTIDSSWAGGGTATVRVRLGEHPPDREGVIREWQRERGGSKLNCTIQHDRLQSMEFYMKVSLNAAQLTFLVEHWAMFADAID